MRREVFRCAFDHTCAFHTIAKDGMGVEDGFSMDFSLNYWLGEAHVGLENDDRVPDGEERDDDIPPGEDADDGTCGVNGVPVATEVEDDGEDPITDEQEAAALEAAQVSGPPIQRGPDRALTELQYEAHLRSVDSPPVERGAEPARDATVAPIGEVLLPVEVPGT